MAAAVRVCSCLCPKLFDPIFDSLFLSEMEVADVVRSNFDAEARLIEDAINKMLPEGSGYAWSRKFVNGEDLLGLDDMLGGSRLFLVPSGNGAPLSPPKLSRRPLLSPLRVDKDMETSVNETIESMSPRSSLRISKEIVKNELSSWIMSIEEGEGQQQQQQRQSHSSGNIRGSCTSIPEALEENVFEYLDHPGSVNSSNLSNSSSGSDSRVTLQRPSATAAAAAGNIDDDDDDDDDESELGYFRLAEEHTDDAIEFDRNRNRNREKNGNGDRLRGHSGRGGTSQSPSSVLIGDDEHDEVNLGVEVEQDYGHDDVHGTVRSGDGDGDGDGDRSDAELSKEMETEYNYYSNDNDNDKEEEEEDDGCDDDAVPGPTLLRAAAAAAAAAGMVHMQEVRGSVSISFNNGESFSLSADSEGDNSDGDDMGLADTTRTGASSSSGGGGYDHYDDIGAAVKSSDFGVYVSDSDDDNISSAGDTSLPPIDTAAAAAAAATGGAKRKQQHKPVKSLTADDIARLENEEQWLEQAIAERIAFLRR
jgi:hypothetical protein